MSKRHSTLKSFSYGSYKGVDELPEEIAALFLDMLNKPEKNVEFTEEIINAALYGRINLTKQFKLQAYEYAIHNNNHIIECKDRVKITYFKAAVIDDISKDGVSESKVSDGRDDFAEVDAENELKWAVNQVKANNDSFIDDLGINLIKVTKKAVAGFPQAIEIIKGVCVEYNQVAEWINIILKSGHSIEDIFPDDVTVDIEYNKVTDFMSYRSDHYRLISNEKESVVAG